MAWIGKIRAGLLYHNIPVKLCSSPIVSKILAEKRLPFTGGHLFLVLLEIFLHNNESLMELQDWAKQNGFEGEVSPKLLHLDFIQHVTRMVPLVKYLQYKSSTNQQQVLERSILMNQKELLKQELCSTLDPFDCSIGDQVSDVHSKLVLVELFTQQLYNVIERLKGLKDEIPRISSRPLQTLLDLQLGLDLNLNQQNQLLKQSLTNHVSQSITNSKLEEEVLELKAKALERVESLPEQQLLDLRNHACLNLLDFIKSKKGLESIPEGMDTKIDNNQMMDLELQYVQNNQVIVDTISTLQTYITRLTQYHTSTLQHISDSKHSFKQFQQLKNDCLSLVQGIQETMTALIELIPNVDLPRMASGSTLQEWRWVHDPTIQKLKRSLGVPVSIPLDTFKEVVGDRKANTEKVQKMNEELERLGGVLESLREKCFELDTQIQSMTETRNQDYQDRVQRFDTALETFKECLKVKDEVEEVKRDRDWYLDHREEVLDETSAM